MDYSNESFERFQATLGLAVEKDSLLWLLRDALFVEAFYGMSRQLAFLYPLPGAWMPLLLHQWLSARRMKRHWSLPQAADASHHFLFLSDRNNHTARLFPLYREQCTKSACVAWYTQPSIRDLASAAEAPDFHCVAGRWSDFVSARDFQQSRKLTRELVKLFPNDLDLSARNAIRIYLIQFLAWERFWESALGERPASVVTTFEKASDAKSFFFAALRKNVPRRIHWIHGLRHASIQATLATDLWCMTPGDVRFFKERVPDFCIPSVKDNPEAHELAKTVGVLDPASLRQDGPIHFLFLGPGLEASYTKEMRMADLAIIRKIQQEVGERISWRFRPHPSAVERFRSELAESGIEIQDFSTRHLHEDLKWSHAAGSAWSSLLLDISETGRPIFWVQAEIRSLGAVDELIADGIGTHLDLLSASEKLTALWHPRNDNPK